MNRVLRNCLVAALAGALGLFSSSALPAQEVRKSLPALSAGETLRFRLLWPSGVSMGEAVMTASAGQNDLHFEMTVEAALPVYNLSGSFSSSATREGLCSLHYHRKMIEGPKVSEETIEFDQKNHQAQRTLGGQSASVAIPPCARDPLTFLYYYRNQLAAGSPADSGTFFLGPGRTLEVKPAGAESISVRGRERSAAKYVVTYRATNSAKSFELWFSVDARREPLMVRLPSALAIFSAELE